MAKNTGRFSLDTVAKVLVASILYALVTQLVASAQRIITAVESRFSLAHAHATAPRRRLGAANIGGPIVGIAIAIVIVVVVAFVAAYIVGYMFQTLPSAATSLSFVQSILTGLTTAGSAYNILFVVLILVAFILIIFYLLMLGGYGGAGGGVAPGA